MISRLMEDEIRRIVRDEIAQDEARRIKQERGAADVSTLGWDLGGPDAAAVVRCTQRSNGTLDFDVARLDDLKALDQGAVA